MTQACADETVREWMLRVAGGGVARLSLLTGSDEALRVDIQGVGSRSYDIQLNRPHFGIRAGNQYAVEFRARADGARKMYVGFAEAHQPWDGLGLYQRVDLTPVWRDFRAEFVAPGNEDNGRIHFDLGDSSNSVEIGAVRLVHLPDGSAVEPSALKQVDLGTLRRVTPVSTNWGLDRGLPIDRYYIRQFLGRNADAVAGRVLEVGDNSYTREFGGERVTRSDVLHVSESSPYATIVGDLTSAPHIPSNSFDCIILTQTLQLIYDVPAAIGTVYRILRPGGVLLTTFPGISQTYDHEWADQWYWRFTTLSARRLFGDAFSPGAVAVESFGNVLAAISFLHGLAAGELTRAELDHYDSGFDVTIAVRAHKADA